MRILIVEDEFVIASRIERLCKDILHDKVTQIKIFHDLIEAKSYIDHFQIDLLFLDLNLKGEDGFNILETTQANSFYTIIISAYDERAIEAFHYPVIDFIEKPFNEDRLRMAFSKLNSFEHKNNFASKFISLKKGSEIKLIAIDSIVHIKGAGVYSELVINDGSTELHHLNLEKIDLLLPKHFMRIHKSYILNLYCIDKIINHGGSKYSIQLKDKYILPLSRAKYPELKAYLSV